MAVLDSTFSTLARLSFWVRPERLAEFKGVYRQKLLPLIQPLGLVEAEEPARPGPPGVFSRLFALESPALVTTKRALLHKHPPWQEAMHSLAADFGTGEALPYHWSIYRTRAGPGRTVVAGPGFRKGTWLSFGIRDGLSASAIAALFRDRTGNLWLATVGGGACRYDGANFTTFTTADGLAGEVVYSITEDREGNLWFGTDGGASRYDGREFRTFTIADGLAHASSWAMLQDQAGNLWFGTWGGGVSRYDGREFRTFTIADGLAYDHVTSILQDREGNLWFGTWGGGVSRYDGKVFVAFTTADGLAHNGGIRSMAEDREGGIWFATAGDGLSRYNPQGPEGGKFARFTREDGLPDNTVGILLVDSAGQLWVGTHQGGVGRYNGEKFTHFTTRDGLSSNTVIGLAEDCAGHLWCGTWGGGICRYEGYHLTTFTSAQGLRSEGVIGLAEDCAGHLWCGTWGGLSRYDGERFVHFTTADGLGGNVVWTVLEDRKGRLWFGTDGGVSCCDGKEFATFTTEHGLAHDNVRCIAEDRHGYLWFGTHEGVSRYDGEGIAIFTAGSLGRHGVRGIIEDREGNLWFGTDGGVSRYDGEGITTFTTEHGLAHNWVNAIVEDREGYLWFGTDGGVSRYDGKEFVTFTIEQGLTYNKVIAIFQDRGGYLWFSTWGGGVSRYDGQVFQRLDRQDGLPHDAVHRILQDRRGDIWIATEGGLTRYRPQHLPPTTHITEVITDRRHGPLSQVELPVSQKRLVFEFQGRSWTTRPDRMVYVYRLQGHQDPWQVTYQQHVEYQDLSLGEYCFQVRAVDRDLNYSAEPAQVRVSVVPDPLVEGLTAALSQTGRSEEFVGISPALYEVQCQLAQVVDVDIALLIRGETGTGKGLAARIVHSAGPRKNGPFITVSCGALPELLVESELFGHEKGAFTGAHTRRLGKVELAQGGTLFLDEIGDLPLEAQGKLLHLLEEYAFERVGGAETLCADVRVIAATNRDVEQMVADGQLRQDLYFRLKVFEVLLPPLRQRREDIPLLALYFMGRMATHIDKRVSHFTPEALALLQSYHWPGNVRELQHVVERAVVVCAGPQIGVPDIALEVGKTELPLPGEVVSLEEMERRYIRQVLEQTGWVIGGPKGACALLGLPESTLRHRLKKLGIRRK